MNKLCLKKKNTDQRDAEEHDAGGDAGGGDGQLEVDDAARGVGRGGRGVAAVHPRVVLPTACVTKYNYSGNRLYGARLYGETAYMAGDFLVQWSLALAIKTLQKSQKLGLYSEGVFIVRDFNKDKEE